MNFAPITFQKVSRASALLTFLLCSMQLIAQTTLTFKTGFTGVDRSIFPTIIKPVGDTLKLTYDYSVSNNALTGRRMLFFDKSNLAALDTLQIARALQPTGTDEGFDIFKDKKGTPVFYLSYYTNFTTNSLELEFYRNNKLYQIGTLAFSKPLGNRGFLGSAFKKDKFYLVTANKFLRPDTIFLDVIDTSGTTVKSDFYTANDSSRAVIKMISYREEGIQFHPKNDSLLILPSFRWEDDYLALINIYNTQKVNELKLPDLFYPLNGLMGTDAAEFKAYEDYFVFAGFGPTLEFFPNTPNYVPFYHRRSWDNDSLELRLFNNMQQDMRAVASSENPYGNEKYIVGSVPFDISLFHANEVREVVIYRWNQWGQDSIVLFGEQNHVATDVAADKSGDLFICGNYNNFPNSDSNRVFLTKIPQYAIGLIDEGKIEPKFRVYPNPTAQFLHLTHSENEASYRVLNEAGAIQLKGELDSNTSTIDVSALSPGTYLLFIESENGLANSIFIKQ